MQDAQERDAFTAVSVPGKLETCFASLFPYSSPLIALRDLVVVAVDGYRQCRACRRGFLDPMHWCLPAGRARLVSGVRCLAFPAVNAG